MGLGDVLVQDVSSCHLCELVNEVCFQLGLHLLQEVRPLERLKENPCSLLGRQVLVEYCVLVDNLPQDPLLPCLLPLLRAPQVSRLEVMRTSRLPYLSSLSLTALRGRAVCARSSALAAHTQQSPGHSRGQRGPAAMPSVLTIPEEGSLQNFRSPGL